MDLEYFSKHKIDPTYEVLFYFGIELSEQTQLKWWLIIYE